MCICHTKIHSFISYRSAGREMGMLLFDGIINSHLKSTAVTDFMAPYCAGIQNKKIKEHGAPKKSSIYSKVSSSWSYTISSWRHALNFWLSRRILGANSKLHGLGGGRVSFIVLLIIPIWVSNAMYHIATTHRLCKLRIVFKINKCSD